MTARVLRERSLFSFCSLSGFPCLLLGQRSLASRRFGFLVSPPPGYIGPAAELTFNTRITRRGALLPPHSARLTVCPYIAAPHRFLARPLSLSACTMAASGKIDLNSPSISWKEAKNYLKGLKEKQRREHYAVKDYIKLKDIPTWKDKAKKTNAKQPEEVKFPKNKDLNDKISIIRGDITKLELDAIVNAGLDPDLHQTSASRAQLQF